jgi:hypothetical protein
MLPRKAAIPSLTRLAARTAYLSIGGMNYTAFGGRITASDEEAARSLATFLKEIGPSATLETWLRGYSNLETYV